MNHDVLHQDFVLHDADPSGYLICRALREETRRMPGYTVDVIDLGLTYEQAVSDLGLGTEEFERKKALPAGLELGKQALDAFGGWWDERRKVWLCSRVELNAFTPQGLVAFIERGLEANGAAGKVEPQDGDVLQDEYAEQLRMAIRRRLLQDLEQEVEEEFEQAWAEDKRPDVGDLRTAVTQGLRADPHSHWRAVLGDVAARQIRVDDDVGLA
jgi:hypothetical protein